jgi:hypothetical protein
MLTAFLQSLKLGDHLTVRHATTFVVGLSGIAALLPIARLSAGRWAGPVAVGLCLITGYLYGSLFFTPIDVPFLAAMTWATAVLAGAAILVLALIVGLAPIDRPSSSLCWRWEEFQCVPSGDPIKQIVHHRSKYQQCEANDRGRVDSVGHDKMSVPDAKWISRDCPVRVNIRSDALRL